MNPKGKLLCPLGLVVCPFFMKEITVNIQLTICDAEDQVYTNNQHVTVENIRNAIMGSKLKPCVGNFPHMNGDFQLVEITHVISTYRDDNAGLDISDVIKRIT